MTDGWYVYIVECRDGSLYTGIAKDLNKRVLAHNAGRGARYTKGRGPVILRYAQPLADRSAATKRESEIKKLTKAQKNTLICKQLNLPITTR